MLFLKVFLSLLFVVRNTKLHNAVFSAHRQSFDSSVTKACVVTGPFKSKRLTGTFVHFTKYSKISMKYIKSHENHSRNLFFFIMDGKCYQTRLNVSVNVTVDVNSLKEMYSKMCNLKDW